MKILISGGTSFLGRSLIPKLQKKECKILLFTTNKGHFKADKIFNKIRSLHPSPGTYTTGPSGTLKIINANVIKESHNFSPGTVIRNNNELIVACGENTSLEIKKVQKPGKNIITISAYLNGTKLNIGDQFGNSK